MGSDHSCNVDMAPVLTSYLDFEKVPENGSLSYVNYRTCEGGKKECKIVDHKVEIKNEAKKVEYRTVKPNFDNIYDTGKYCHSDTPCQYNPNDNSNKPIQGYAPDELEGTKFITSIPSYQKVRRLNEESDYENIIIDPNDTSANIFANPPYALRKDIYVQQMKYMYEGQFGHVIYAGPELADIDTTKKKLNQNNVPNTKIKDPLLIWLYETQFDINYFNTNVFEDWLYLIRTGSALKILLNDIRELIASNKELILLHRVNKTIGPYLRKISRDCSFVDLPFGPPLIHLPNSYVLPFKLYHPNVLIENTIDKNNNKYDTSMTRNTVINTVSADIKNNKYKALNYLDNSFTKLIDVSKYFGVFDNSKALSIIIPRMGCQLFEATSDTQDTTSSDRIISGTNMVSMLPIDITQAKGGEAITVNGKTVPSRIVMCVGQPIDKILGENYDNVTGSNEIHAPIITAKNENKNIIVDINTSSTDENNKVFIYASKPARCSGNFLAKCKHSTNSVTKLTNSIIHIEYDGNETKETPVVLEKRFK